MHDLNNVDIISSLEFPENEEISRTLLLNINTMRDLIASKINDINIKETDIQEREKRINDAFDSLNREEKEMFLNVEKEFLKRKDFRIGREDLIEYSGDLNFDSFILEIKESLSNLIKIKNSFSMENLLKIEDLIDKGINKSSQEGAKNFNSMEAKAEEVMNTKHTLNIDEVYNNINENINKNNDDLSTEGNNLSLKKINSSSNKNLNTINTINSHKSHNKINNEKSLKYLDIPRVISEGNDELWDYRSKKRLNSLHKEKEICLTSSSILDGTRLNKTFYLIKHKRIEQMLNSSHEIFMHDLGGHDACCRLKKNYEMNINDGLNSNRSVLKKGTHKRSSSMPTCNSFFNKKNVTKDGDNVLDTIINEEDDTSNNKFIKNYKQIEMSKNLINMNKQKQTIEKKKIRDNYLINKNKIKYSHIQSRYNNKTLETSQNGRILFDKNVKKIHSDRDSDSTLARSNGNNSSQSKLRNLNLSPQKMNSRNKNIKNISISLKK